MKHKILCSAIALFINNSIFANEYLFKNQFNYFLEDQKNNQQKNNSPLEISSVDELKSILDHYITKNSSTTYVTGIPFLIQCDKFNDGKKSYHKFWLSK